jgi:DNA-binding transcriptional LysR family regulator
MDKLESIKVFVAVARAGGFSAASRELGQPVATVSRKVAELEASLGVRLFERSTRQVTLTDHAVAYFEACQRLLDDLRDADATMVGEHSSPKGELTITAPTGFGRQHVQPVATEFLNAFPEVDLRLLLTDRVIGLIDEHADLAVRIKTLSDSSLVARPLGHIKLVVCASPGYLQTYGTPSHPSELRERHTCITWATLGPFKAWSFKVNGSDIMVPIRSRVTTTTPDSVMDAAIAGLGLAQMTSYQAEAAVRAGALVPVLRGFEETPTPVSLVHPSSRRAPQKLRAFIDFAAPRLSARLTRIGELL